MGIEGAEYDRIALEAAREIEALNWSNPVQRRAAIQCVIVETLRKSQSKAATAYKLRRLTDR
ncbi:hypothetical protein [Bradyrhizobium sp. Ec3.3]|uniref:hypothetical protein n=1 Tax=Bradyrhizobium sp. Ec3.3 TaxID=189753 RepID=UPI0004861AAC|nr:hypothetical protein [Bradyrhizobium sp. Ec3.3]